MAYPNRAMHRPILHAIWPLRTYVPSSAHLLQAAAQFGNGAQGEIASLDGQRLGQNINAVAALVFI